jgi:hypothetical protein
MMFMAQATGSVSGSRAVALVALLALAFAAVSLSLIAGIAASTAVLVWAAVADTLPRGARRPNT